MARAIANFEEFFPDLISEKVKASSLDIYRQGKYLFGKVPYGYTRDADLYIDPVSDELEIVKEIFDLHRWKACD